MLTLLELSLSEVAANDGVAVTIHAIGEVLASHANDATFPALKLVVIHESPLLYHTACIVCLYQARIWVGVKGYHKDFRRP